MLVILATSYPLNRNDRVSNFYWTRGSELSFLTCFSYFSLYFHVLVFLRNRYLLFFCAFLGCRGIQFLVLFLVPLAHRAGTLYMHPHVSHTEGVRFLKQDACGNLVVASLLVNFPFSAFCRRFLVQTFVGLNMIHTFLSHKNPQTNTFLRDLGLAKLRSTARIWNSQGNSKLVNKVDCCLSYDSILALRSRQ
jgi:hypothetical protein